MQTVRQQQHHRRTARLAANRKPNAEAYEQAEPALIAKLLEVRGRLIEADLGQRLGRIIGVKIKHKRLRLHRRQI